MTGRLQFPRGELQMTDCVHLLGYSVRNSRTQLGLTQGDAAERAGLNIKTVLNIENFKGNPKFESVHPLIRALNIDSNTIFYPEIYDNDGTIHEMQVLMSQCSEQERRLLLHVCKAVLSGISSDTFIVTK